MTWIDQITIALTRPRTLLLLELAVKPTVLLLLVTAMASRWKGKSAAGRDVLWMTTFVCLVVLPILNLLLPGWQLMILPEADVWKHKVLSASHAGTLSVYQWVLVVWLAGSAVATVRLWRSYRTARSIIRESKSMACPQSQQILRRTLREIGIHRQVRLLVNPSIDIPVVFGYFRPCVLLPGSSASWTAERLGVVLQHELFHVRRADMLTQLIVSAASVIYWWHPLTWLALKRLVEERERACDDLVLLSGHRASDYAAHLLAIATSVRMGLSRPSGMFISMASRPQIKQRIQAILEDRKRGPISLVASVPAVLMVSLVLAVLVALHPASVRSDAAWFDAAALVDQITLKKRYGIRDVVFSPDGTQLVTAGSGDSIRFWDPATGVQIDKWVARAGDETISVDVAVDNSKLVALSASGGIDVWDGRREGKLAAFQLPRHFQFVAIHPAGTMMAAIGNNEGVYLCRIGRTVGASLVDDGSLCATCCAFSPDGSYFAIGTDEGDIRVWSLNSPEEFRRIHRAHEGPVDSLVFTSDERQVLSCGPAASAVSTDSNSRGQRQIRIWDAEHGLAIGELQLGTLHAGPCRLAIAPDADLLAVDCTSTSTLWNLSQRRPWFTVEHGEPNDGRPVSVMDVSADGRFVARLGDDQKAQVWDMATSKPTVAPGNPHRHRVTSVELVADGHHVISTGLDGRLAMWNIETAQLARLYSAPLAKPTMVACARKRNVFVLCVDVAPDEADTASELLVYDVQQNTPRAEYRFRDSVRAITVDPLGTTVAVASSVTVESLHKGQMRTRIQMLDSRTGEVRGESRFHDADVVDLRFSRDGQTVGLISVDGSIRRWQVDSPETSLELSLGAPVAGGRLSSDLSCVFALMENRYGTGDATISRFNLDDGKTTPIVELRNRTVSACSVSEDMRHVAIGTHGAATDSRLRIHDGADGSLIRSIDLYGRQVTTVTFSADATQIIAGLDNGDIVVWDIAPGTTSD